MENPEEILHSLEEFSKMKPKDIPRELEEYLCFVAKTGNPVYQWQTIKSLFREKLLSVITDFYESCPSVEIPPCPNVEMFNYDLMKNFILEKLDTFASAPFTVQRICELLTTPRKEYNRIDKYMRALEKNILVVSTTEPGRRSTENGESVMNGIESEHLPESSNSSHDINVEEMDEPFEPFEPFNPIEVVLFPNKNENQALAEVQQSPGLQETFENGSEGKLEMPSSSTSVSTQPQLQNQQETVITCRGTDGTQRPYVLIEPVALSTCTTAHQETIQENQADSSVTITAVPAGVQQRRTSIERVDTVECVATDDDPEPDEIKETTVPEVVDEQEKEEETPIPEEQEQIVLAPPCPEPIVELATETKIEIHSEEASLVVQEESGIENISPENSSSPETLQIDINPEQEKNEAESIQKVEDQPQDEEKEDVLLEEPSKWPEEEVKTTELPQEPADTESSEAFALSVKETEENEVISESSEATEKCIDEEKVTDEVKEDDSLCQNISESVDESLEKITSTDELIHEEQVQDKEAESVPVSKSECKIDCGETPMEVDVVNETEVRKEEDSINEEPSSTSTSVVADL